MTNETKSRIREYKEALPHMKERVFGALLMLVIAVGVVVSSTYAWVTLSRSPEASKITTTLVANGALEIALAKPDGSMPEEFDIDESLDGDPSVVVSNLQWGNLVNLSDPTYGIDNLALRPAQLNASSLLTSPLWGAVYGSDGRITNLDSNYAYAKYNGTQFLTSDEYGVRAIATYKDEVSDATQQEYNEKVQAVLDAHTRVNQTYDNVAGKFSALGTMISKYAQDKLDDGYTNLAPYISNMLPIYNAVLDTMEAQKEAYVALANLQNYLYTNEINGTFVALTWDDLYANRAQYNTESADKNSSNGNISLVGLTQFVTDYEKIVSDIAHLEAYYNDYKANASPYYWGGSDGTTNDNSESGYTLSQIVAHLIDYSSMTIDLDNNGTETGVTSLSADNATSLLSANGNERKVYIYKGILARLEKSSIDDTYRLNGKASCTIKVSYVMSITVYGKAYTKVTGACTFMDNFAKSQGAKLVANDAVAEDTYGLAIDLWVRTNAEQTCLTLEGATSTDVQGNIVSYDGINRVWGSTGEAVLTTDSTTQGGGSCYIYYADTPEDMARSRELLNAMKVAFVDAYGNLLATAEMDTENVWAVNGRVTVPLVLDSQTKTTYTYTDEENTVLTGYAVTTLYTDEAVRITAIVYLDGTYLTNDHVLAAAEIQGTLNIQFGSSVDLKTVGNNELIDDTRSVTAMADKYSLDYDTAVSGTDDLVTTVTLNVDGVQPDRITAFFVRAINSTQGTREETMVFEKQADGSWTHAHEFEAPGTYYLRHVRLDGVDYTLHEPLEITVSGFALSNVTWGEMEDSVTVLTSANSYSVDVSAAFATTDTSKMPVAVQIRFTRDNGNVINVPLTYSSSTGQWTGKAEFGVSGVYTMNYIVYTIKGDTTGRLQDLGSFKKDLDLSLGMYVKVEDQSGKQTEEYEEGAFYEKNVAVRVYNNANAELAGLTDLRLFYSNGASLTNTIWTELVWDDVNGFYTGTLPIASPGRFQFAYVELAGQKLSTAKESPIYTIISPDPPIYDSNSTCTENNDNGLQMVPLSNDAKISGLIIENSSAADVSVVVYSETAQQYFELSRSDGRVDVGGNTWTIKLPTYTLDLDDEGNPLSNATYTQEGKWSLVAVKISNCYDASGELRDATNPIVWSGTDKVSKDYLSNWELTADASYDFSALTTNVSTTVKVTMVPGNTVLGGNGVEFMTTFYASDLESYVTITDDYGNVIPSSKISSVTLNLSYIAPTTDAYGYAVLSGANKTYALAMGNYNAETGRYTVSSTDYWQYVGEYTVQNLTATIGGVTKTYYLSDSIGLPAKYTVTTAGPSAEDITMTVTQTGTEFGKTGSNVTGTFLQAYSPNIRANFGLSSVTGTNYVDMSSIVSSVDLMLTYQDGKAAPNGGYSWLDSSVYENITLNMTRNDSGVYMPGSTPLLAGTYAVKVVANVGGNEIEQEKSHIEVYSKAPTLKVTAVNPGIDKTFNVDTHNGDTKLYSEAALVSVQNYISNAGDLANVYISVTSEDQAIDGDGGMEAFVRYTLPKVTLQLGNVDKSGFVSAEALVPNAANSSYNVTYTFSQSELSKTNEIGGKEEKSEAPSESGCTGGEDITLYWDVQYNAGEQTIAYISMTDSSGLTYTVTLDTPVTIREENVAPPAISYKETEGYNAFDTQVSETGDSFQVTLPTAEQFGTTVKANVPVISGNTGSGWTSDDLDSQSSTYLYYVTTGSLQENQKTTSSGCSGSTTTTYYYYDFTYHQYERVQRIYKKTTETEYRTITYGLTGWKIGDTVYQPGETITVNGIVTAVPVIEELSWVLLRKEVATITHITIQDVDKGTSTYTGGKETTTDKAVAKNQYTNGVPSGYTAFNPNDPFEVPETIYTQETQYGDDTTESS